MKNIHKILLSVLSGILLAVSWVEIGNITPLIFVAFVPLLLVENINSKENKGVFQLSYLAFFIFNLLTTWWVYYASFFGAVMAIVFNSLFMAIVFQLYSFTKKQVGQTKGFFILVCLWLGFEYLHLNWDLSWPWLTLGNNFAGTHKWIQWYEYSGHLGGSLWVLAVNYSVFSILKNAHSVKEINWKRFWIPLTLILAPILVSLKMYHSYKEQGTKLNFVVVQPNIDPYNEKFGGMSAEDQIKKMLQLAEQKASDSVDYYVFPETALPHNIWENDLYQHPHYKAIKEFQKKHRGSKIIIGISSARYFEPTEPRTPTARDVRNMPGWYDSYNTAMYVDIQDSVQLYHKSKLVLGVEKIPFPAVFKYFEKFAINLGGATGSLGSQKDRSVFESPGKYDLGRVAPIICYESVYGDYVTGYIKNGANILAIITNDGWWDDTPGYKQHLAYAKLRAIENRRSIARSANTGISAFITQRGDVFNATQWWVPAVISGSLYGNDELTVFSETGDLIGRTASFLACLLLLWAFVRKKSSSSFSLR